MAETFTPDNLFAGNIFPVVPAHVTVASGAGALARGTVLGKITASGKCVAVDSTLNTGAEAPYAVLAQAVDATSADVACAVYLTGEFNEGALVFGGTDTAANHRDAARKIGMFFRTAVPA